MPSAKLKVQALLCAGDSGHGGRIELLLMLKKWFEPQNIQHGMSNFEG